VARSKSSDTLSKLIASDKGLRDRLTGEGGIVHRTLLWKWAAGHVKPTAEHCAELERITRGKVKANGWEDLADEKQGAA